MNDNRMRERSVKHYRDMAPRYAATKMAELAPGVIAVEDAAGECDVLFDITLWEFTHKELWAGLDRSKMIEEEQLNVLEGIGRSPRVDTIEGMMRFAQSHLSPIGSHTFHPEPIPFDHTQY